MKDYKAERARRFYKGILKLMKRIVITGATGFIGQYMTQKLIENNWEVFVVVRPDSKHKEKILHHPNIQVINLDISIIENVVRLVGHADVFCHLAWSGVNRGEIDSDTIHSENVINSLKCAGTALKLGCKVFLDAGSRAEYGIVEGVMREDIDCNPITAYGKAKLEFYRATEKMMKENMVTYYHLRIFSVYGDGDHPWSLISMLTRDLSRGKKVSLSPCLHKWNYMYITDLVNAIYGLIERGMYRDESEQIVVNICGNDTRPLYEFVHEIHRLTNGKSILEFGSYIQGKEGAVSIIPDNSRLLNLLGEYKEEYSFVEGIQCIINNLRD